MNIRRATISDSKALSTVVLEASQSVKDKDFTNEGWGLLKQTNTPAAFENRFKGDNYLSLVCEIDRKIVGYLAMIDKEKIDHMFVLPHHRKKGVCKRLWAEALKECSDLSVDNYYWVRSSSYAEPVYQSFGFRPMGERQRSNGISFQLMELGNK